MIRNVIFLTVAILTMTACKKPNGGGIVLDESSDIRLLNPEGQNLLQPTTPNYLKKENIKLYYLVNGQKKEVLNPDLDSPRNFFIFQVGPESKHYSNEYLIRVFANADGELDETGKEKTTTYIEWNPTDIDTLVCLLRKPGKSVFCEKVWYNGVVKWDNTSNPKIKDESFPGRFFQVIKQ